MSTTVLHTSLNAAIASCNKKTSDGALRISDKAGRFATVNLEYLIEIEEEIKKGILFATVQALEDAVKEFNDGGQDWTTISELYQTKGIIRFYDPVIHVSNKNFDLAATDFSAGLGEVTHLAEIAKTVPHFATLMQMGRTHELTHQFIISFRKCIKKASDDTALVSEKTNVVTDVYLNILRNYTVKDAMDPSAEECNLDPENSILFEKFQRDFKKASEEAMLFVDQAKANAETALAYAVKYEECIKQK